MPKRKHTHGGIHGADGWCPGVLCTEAMPSYERETDPQFLGSRPPRFLPPGAANAELPGAGRGGPIGGGIPPPRRDRSGLGQHCHRRCRGRLAPRPAGEWFTFAPALPSRHTPDTKPRPPAATPLPTCANAGGGHTDRPPYPPTPRPEAAAAAPRRPPDASPLTRYRRARNGAARSLARPAGGGAYG